MKLYLNVCNKTNFSLSRNGFVSVIKSLLKKRGIKAPKLQIDLNIISARKIAEINKKYRKIDGPTDVLSFSYINDRDFVNSRDGIVHLGDIFIAPSVVRKNAASYKTVLKQELSRVLIHGLLHLFGYEHENNRQKRQEMENMENDICLNLENKGLMFQKKRQNLMFKQFSDV